MLEMWVEFPQTQFVKLHGNKTSLQEFSPMLAETTKYPHRRNLDGTWDSICKKCYQTIANCDTENELDQFERVHVCNQPNPAMHPLRAYGLNQ